MFFIYCLPPSLVSAFYRLLAARYVQALGQSVERLVHACTLCAPAHQSAVKRVHVHVCLLAGIKGQTEKDIMESVEIAERLFDYYSVNLFCPNSTSTEKDEELSRLFIEKLAPEIRKSRKAEVLIENTDLGVG